MQRLDMDIKLPLIITFSLLTAVLRAQQAPTDEEALRAGHRIENASDSMRPVELTGFLDIGSLIDNLKKKSDALKDPAFLRGFMETFPKGMAGIGARINSTASGGSFRLIKEYDRSGVKHLLFRGFGNSGISYFDFTLIKLRDSVKASDVYLYTVGEDLSTTLAELVEKMAGKDLSEVTEEGQMMTKFKQFRDHKDYGNARDVYDHMNKQLRESKPVQIIYIGICRHLNDSLYENALQHFANAFPDAPNPYLLQIDLYYLKKDPEEGLVAVDKLDNIVNTDPYLNLFRGNFCKLAGKESEALAYYKKLYLYDPDLGINTRQLIRSYAKAGQIEEAKTVIGRYRQSPSFTQKDLDLLYTQYPGLK
jgi:tetratricopeptide (TPR) repeat protein